MRPAIIFIDEIDAVGGERGSDNNSEREQTLNQLLVEMDGFGTANDVVVIAASNLLEKLDQALLRPGRFDRQIFVSPPDVAGREEIMKVHTRGKPLGNVDLSMIARQTSGLTGADLANLCNEAAIFAARQHRDSSPTPTSTPRSSASWPACSRAARSTSTSAASSPSTRPGHALCAELLPGVDRVHKISIVPRGRALGYTLNLPEEDRYLKTREELHRPHDGAARRPRGGGDRVRRDHHRRLRRPLTRRRDLALDGPRLRDGHHDRVAARLRTRAAWSPTARASCATRSSST